VRGWDGMGRDGMECYVETKLCCCLFLGRGGGAWRVYCEMLMKSDLNVSR
jgi:hypothetical protein